MNQDISQPELPSSRIPVSRLSRKEAMRVLGVSEDTMTRYVKNGIVSVAERIGQMQFFEYADLQMLVGIKGRWKKTKRRLLDTRKNLATLNEELE